MEVTAALAAMLAAYLVLGRAKRTNRIDQLALVAGLTVTAGANLLFAALPAAIPALAGDRFATWAAVCGRIFGATLIAAGAWLPARPSKHRVASARGVLVACVVALLAIAAVVATTAERLPIGIDPTLAPNAAGRPILEGNPLIHGAQLLTLTLFAAAAIGFVRRADRSSLQFEHWLAAACIVAAYSRLHYFLFPSLYSEWVYTGDAFRLAFHGLLLVAVGREISGYQRQAEEAAAFDERRRLARDLHDGLAQELGFIAMHARTRLAHGDDSPALMPIASAAERAVDEARRAIAALVRPADEPLDVAVAQAAEDVAHRVGTHIRFELEPDVHVEPTIREELVRIVREAVSNAGRHGHAESVTVRLSNGNGVHLRISDDGVGFPPGGGRVGGFGLTTMRERARAVGGELRIESRDGGGTDVEVVVPQRQAP